MAQSPQSTEFDILMNSVLLKIKFATGLADSVLHEWYGDERPTFDGQQHICYRLTDWAPEMYSGAGRLASLTEVALEVRIWTVFSVDKAGDNKAWFRDAGTVRAGRGHWKRMLQCLNAFDNKNLFVAYDPITGEGVLANDDRLTIRPLQQIGSRFVEIPKADTTWGCSRLLFSLGLVKPLTIS